MHLQRARRHPGQTRAATIVEFWGSIPVIVVGNKTDKVHRNLSTSRMRNKRKEREELKKAKRGLFIVLNIDKSNIYSIYFNHYLPRNVVYDYNRTFMNV